MLNRKSVIVITLLLGLFAGIVSAQSTFEFTNDGRLNSYDAAAPIVIYPDGSGGLVIYRVDPATGGGILELAVPSSTLALEGFYLLARNAAGDINVFKEGNEFVVTGVAPNLETYVFRVTDPTTNLGFRSYTLHYPIYTTAEELLVPVEEVEDFFEPTVVVTTPEETATEAPTTAPATATPDPVVPAPTEAPQESPRRS